MLGVRFRVGAAGPALGIPAAELRDRTIPVAALWGQDWADRVLAAVPERRRPAGRAAARPCRRARAPRRWTGRFARARWRPPAARGCGALAGELGLSERQLRRRFAAAVGYGPKTLARVLRLQRFLTLAARGEQDLARLALDAGYADQPHLGNDCRRLTGLTPAQLLATGAGPAGEAAVLRG